MINTENVEVILYLCTCTSVVVGNERRLVLKENIEVAEQRHIYCNSHLPLYIQ